MTTTEPVQGGPYPVPSDPPDGPSQMGAIVTWAAGRLVMRFASVAARDAVMPTPVEGMLCSTGSGSGQVLWLGQMVGTEIRWVDLRAALSPAWQSFTPSWANLNPGTAGTVVTRYLQIGKLVQYQGYFQYSGATSGGSQVGTNPRVQLPVNARMVGVAQVLPLGSVSYLDNGTTIIGGYGRLYDATSAQFMPNSGTGISAASPFTWAAGDQLAWNFTYEAA